MEMLFSSWMSLLRILVIGTLAYFALVALLRYFGKRALAKMNTFDIVVTIAMGSALASSVLSQQVALADGVAAFLLLLVLQRSFAALAVKLGWFGKYLKAQPSLLIYRGVILWDTVRKEKLTEVEIYGGLRSNGVAALEDVLAMVLESDGSFSVLKKSAAEDGQLPFTLKDVAGVPEFSDQAAPEAQRKLRRAS